MSGVMSQTRGERRFKSIFVNNNDTRILAKYKIHVRPVYFHCTKYNYRSVFNNVFTGFLQKFAVYLSSKSIYQNNIICDLILLSVLHGGIKLFFFYILMFDNNY